MYIHRPFESIGVLFEFIVVPNQKQGLFFKVPVPRCPFFCSIRSVWFQGFIHGDRQPGAPLTYKGLIAGLIKGTNG